MFSKFDSYLKKARWLRVTMVALGVLLLGGYFIWGIFRNFGYLLTKSTPFPVNLHSATQADYQIDPAYMQIPPMDLQLVIDVIWDQNQSAQELALQLTQVNENFLARVSTVTPQPTQTQTISTQVNTPTATAMGETEQSPLSTSSVTPTPLLASATATSIAPTHTSAPPTNTPPGPTYTSPPPTNTPPGPTNTPLPPTNTPILPTDTPPPPTNTPVPSTNTPLPPSATSLPPTSTPAPCSQLSLSFINTPLRLARWKITNNSGASFTINSIQISWPAANDELEEIYLSASSIWDGSENPPSATISSSWNGGDSRRTVSPFSDPNIAFYFDDYAQSSGYSLTIIFSGGCSKSSSH